MQTSFNPYLTPAKSEIIKRKDALALGRKRFYTGKPCVHNHDSERFVTTGGCVKCNAMRSKLFASNATTASNARLRGAFMYRLHPDDFAAALAYCQGLDLARGRVPESPELRRPPTEDETRAAIAATRRHVIANESREMHPSMAAQLENYLPRP